MREPPACEAPRARALIGPRALWNIYRRRLRAQAPQELLAGLGIALAVALIFATLGASQSVAGSASAVLHAIVGPAQLQLRARGPEGIPESLLGKVEALGSVRQAAPLLEERATIRAAGGRHLTLSLVGSDIALMTMDGLAHTLPAAATEEHAIALTTEAAEALHVPTSAKRAAGTHLTLDIRGLAVATRIDAILGPETVGALSHSLAAVLPLDELQRFARMEHRVSRIFVQAAPEMEVEARHQLEGIAAGRVTVERADQDLDALREVLRPDLQASGLYAAIATLLGFLFAFNAILLTAPERRQMIADFRLGGARRSVIIEIVVFQALILGIASGLAGLLGGYEVFRSFFALRTSPFSQAFMLGGGNSIGIRSALAALGAGVLAILLASAIALLDLRGSHALDAAYLDDGEPGNWVGKRAIRRLGGAAAVLLVVTTASFILEPAVAVPAAALLALASVCSVPVALSAALRVAGAAAARFERLTALAVSVRLLRAATLRSLALVATGAVALFGAIALGGAREDLLQGMREQALAGAVGAQLHVIAPEDTQEVGSFPPHRTTEQLIRLGGIAGAQMAHGEFVPYGPHLIAVFAHPLASTNAVARKEVMAGRPAAAIRRVDTADQVTVSGRLAAELGIGVGGTFSLPTPTGVIGLRVAALTTNLGWPGGAILMSPDLFTRLWPSAGVSAIQLTLSAGSSLSSVKHSVNASLGPHSGLEVLRSSTWATRFYTEVKEGLWQLGAITDLLLVAAITAMSAGVAAIIWNRRIFLSGLRLAGATSSRVAHILLVEVAMLLLIGSFVGLGSGLFAQAIFDSYLHDYVGFPLVAFSSGLWHLNALGAMLICVAALALLPGISALRVSPTLVLAEE